jgi:hypothetical protein
MGLENYETVAERIEKFWAKYENGRIDQKLIYQDGTRYIVQTDLYKNIDDPVPFASDFAEEIRTMSNRFPMENASTSSLGRALHTGSISKFSEGIPRPSAEEMSRVQLTVVPNDDREPISAGVALDVAVREILSNEQPSEKPQCSHGYMLEKSGVGKTGKPYSGFVCGSKTNQCKPIWN